MLSLPSFPNHPYSWFINMSANPIPTLSEAVHDDTSNNWHFYYKDPKHRLVLVSKDKVHFRVSSHRMIRAW